MRGASRQPAHRRGPRQQLAARPQPQANTVRIRWDQLVHRTHGADELSLASPCPCYILAKDEREAAMVGDPIFFTDEVKGVYHSRSGCENTRISILAGGRPPRPDTLKQI